MDERGIPKDKQAHYAANHGWPKGRARRPETVARALELWKKHQREHGYPPSLKTLGKLMQRTPNWIRLLLVNAGLIGKVGARWELARQEPKVRRLGHRVVVEEMPRELTLEQATNLMNQLRQELTRKG